MKNYEFDGVCWMCMKHTKVRCKNLYIIGSEGTDLCWECEKKVHELIQTKRRNIIKEKVQKKKQEKLQKRFELVKSDLRCTECYFVHTSVCMTEARNIGYECGNGYVIKEISNDK